MNIAVLGCGKMSSAIVKGIAAVNSEIKFYTYTPSFTRAKDLAEDIGGIAVKNPQEFKAIDWWIIGCKPQQVKELAKNFGPILEGQNIISIMAATSLLTLRELFKSDNVVRIMPNTPSEYGDGISLALYSDAIKLKERALIKNWFQACGVVYDCKTEEEFDQITLVTGSGPAYLFQLATILESILQKYGVQDKIASKSIITQLFKGSAKLMENQDIEFSEMLNNVCSKGGVTIEAINTIAKENIISTYTKALNSGIERSKEITKQINLEITK